MHRVLVALLAAAVYACATAQPAVAGQAEAPASPPAPGPTDSPGPTHTATEAAHSASDTPSPATRPDRRADEAVRARLRALPRCEPGAEVGQLTFAATRCTLKFCGTSACCNHCSWTATFTTKAGPQPANPELVRAVLALPEGSLDCEITAWNAALAGVSVGLERAGCVVR